jgi:alpha-glucosidase (family GH31 glycosyl hydrolase)
MTATRIMAAPFPLAVSIAAPGIVRITIGEGDGPTYLPKNAAALQPDDPVADRSLPVETGALALRLVDKHTALEFCDRGGKARLRLELSALDLSPRLRLRFEVVGEQHFYGLGQGGQPFDRLGAVRWLWNRHVNHGPGGDIAVPLMLSNAGYGLFFDHSGPATIDPGRSYDVICIDYECAAGPLDFYYLGGTDLRETLGLVATLLGRPTMPPRWALGYLQSTRHFESRADVLGLADTLREKNLPCDALIFLSSYGEALGWNIGVGHLDYQPSLFADPSELIGSLHERGFRVMTHEYPVLHATSPLYDEAAENGYLLDDGYGQGTRAEPRQTDYHQGQRYLDFARPEVGAWWWDRHAALCEDGVDGWWLDGGEGPDGAVEGDPGLHNRYDVYRQQAFAEGEARDRPQRRPFLLCRSGGPGMQRFGAGCWSGDINNTFPTLEAQPSLGLNVGLSGIPYWGTDIGGFYAVAPQTAELFVRWFQFGSFCPIFRAHGRNWRLHLPWSYGEEIEAICRRYIELRYRLTPYTYTLAWQAHQAGLPLMRPLVLNYPDDPRVWEVASEYLWGDDILVAPVTRGGATHWPVYLPAGVWHDFWTNEIFHGPVDINVPAPLDRLPLFVRAGAILPLGPVAQHWDGHAPAEMTLLVYPGGRSSFTLYEDDGETNAYRDGHYALTEFGCETSAEEVVLSIRAAQQADFKAPQGRTYSCRIRATESPRTLEVADSDGRARECAWSFDGAFVIFTLSEAPVQARLRW